LIQIKTELTELKKSGIKYEALGFEAWNKFPYWNFSKVIKEFELKFIEDKLVLNSN
jgi:hypothetical protein